MEPIYVGKGINGRAYCHLKKSHNQHLNFRIAKIRESGHEPIVKFLCMNVCDELAFLCEIEAIALYGRTDLDTGTLCNHTDGGDGISSADAKRLSASFTAEQLSIAAFKAAATKGPEKRKAAALKAVATKGPERLSLAAKKRIANTPFEKLSEAAKKGAASLTPEQRKAKGEKIKKFHASRTPEQTKAQYSKAVETLRANYANNLEAQERRRAAFAKGWATRRAKKNES